MFDLYFQSFEDTLAECRKLHSKPNRSEEETLKLLKLLRKNDEAIQGMKLEMASKSFPVTPERTRLFSQYEKEHEEMSKRVVRKSPGKLYTSVDDIELEDKNRQYVTHYEKMNQMNVAKRNIEETNYAANDIKYILARDKERFQGQSDIIKLMDEDLVLSKELIRKVKKIDNKSKYIYYAGVLMPLMAVLLGLLIKIIRFVKG